MRKVFSLNSLANFIGLDSAMLWAENCWISGGELKIEVYWLDDLFDSVMMDQKHFQFWTKHVNILILLVVYRYW